MKLRVETLEVRQTPSAVAEVEPNNTFSTFQPLDGDSTYSVSGAISSTTDVDFFGFHAKSGSIISLNVRALNPGAPANQQFDPVLGLFNPSGSLVDFDDDSGTGSTWASGLSFTANVAGEWRVAISDYNDFNFDGIGGNGDGFGLDTGPYVLDIAGADDHCQPGDVFADVGLPAISLPIAIVKSTGLELAFDSLDLDFTVLEPGPGIECVAQSNVGTLVASIRNSATSETYAVGYSTAQATLTLFETGLVHWQTAGFEVSAGSVFGVPLPIPLGTWGPYSFDFNVSALGFTPDTEFETIVRAAESYIHVQLSQQLFEPFTQVLVIEDPGQTELLVTGPSGQLVGKTESGAILNEIPGSAYFASVPLAAVVAPRSGSYETQVRGVGSGDYNIVTALVDGPNILTSQSFVAPIINGLTTVYTSTLDALNGTVQTAVDLNQTLNSFAAIPDRLQLEGKITNSGVANSLRAKLTNASARLAAGDVNAARGLLTACLNEIHAQNGKHIEAGAAEELDAFVRYLLTQVV